MGETWQTNKYLSISNSLCQKVSVVRCDRFVDFSGLSVEKIDFEVLNLTLDYATISSSPSSKAASTLI